MTTGLPGVAGLPSKKEDVQGVDEYSHDWPWITRYGYHRCRNSLPREEATLIKSGFMQVEHLDREGEDGANLYWGQPMA